MPQSEPVVVCCNFLQNLLFVKKNVYLQHESARVINLTSAL